MSAPPFSAIYVLTFTGTPICAELSRETPHFAMPVVEERVSLGGGGNVAANMAALLDNAPRYLYS